MSEHLRIVVNHPENDYPPVICVIEAETTARDVLAVVATEWGLNSNLLMLEYEGDVVSEWKVMLEEGIDANTELTARMTSLYTETMFKDPNVLAELPTKTLLHLDTPSFTHNGALDFSKEWLNAIDNLCFSNPIPLVTTIIDNFLAGSKIKSLRADGFKYVRSIPNGFLARCVSLTSIDLSANSEITEIGDDFLWECESLVELNLSGLSKVRVIGSSCLGVCESLVAADFSKMTSLTSVGDMFMYSCVSLAQVDLSGFGSVELIGNLFLCDCSSLEQIDLGTLKGVSSIGNSFLQGCSSLSAINLDSLSNTTTVGDDFMRGCESLTSVDLSALEKMVHIPDRFLLACSSLKSLTVTRQVTSVGDEFMKGCKSLKTITFPDTKLHRIGDDFLSGCESLQDINWSVLKEVTAVGTSFLNMTNISHMWTSARLPFFNSGSDTQRGDHIRNFLRMPRPYVSESPWY